MDRVSPGYFICVEKSQGHHRPLDADPTVLAVSLHQRPGKERERANGDGPHRGVAGASPELAGVVAGDGGEVEDAQRGPANLMA